MEEGERRRRKEGLSVPAGTRVCGIVYVLVDRQTHVNDLTLAFTIIHAHKPRNKQNQPKERGTTPLLFLKHESSLA